MLSAPSLVVHQDSLSCQNQQIGDITQYGETLAALKQLKLTVATMDLLIGTLALVENDRLVTRNVRHFEKIPHLRIDRYEGRARQ